MAKKKSVENTLAEEVLVEDELIGVEPDNI